MPLKQSDLIPYRGPADDRTMFWEVADVFGTGEDAVVKLVPRAERTATTAPPELGGATVVPVALLKDVRVYRITDPFAEDAVDVTSTIGVDFDMLGVNPRAWVRAFLDKHGPGRAAADATVLLGWFSRILDAGAARERALGVLPTKVSREPDRTKRLPLAKPRRKRA